VVTALTFRHTIDERPDADGAEIAGEGSSRVGERIGSGTFSDPGSLGSDRLARNVAGIFAAQSVSNVELLLRDGASEASMAIDNQFRVFEACELGLAATWETPDALICMLRTDVTPSAKPIGQHLKPPCVRPHGPLRT
jgi:hypothetical protein